MSHNVSLGTSRGPLALRVYRKINGVVYTQFAIGFYEEDYSNYENKKRRKAFSFSPFCVFISLSKRPVRMICVRRS